MEFAIGGDLYYHLNRQVKTLINENNTNNFDG
jgi:hypothetical protein